VVEVFVADEQDAVPVDVARWARLAESVLDAEGIRGEAELSLLFVDETAMAELNRRFRATDGGTDVLAFPLDDDLIELGGGSDPVAKGPDRRPPEMTDAPLLLGDVVVCPAVAATNAAERSRSLDDELALLVVHGVLHVLGMDHAEPADAARMQARERDLLERFHRA
jgi:probable rRNA maturation factor